MQLIYCATHHRHDLDSCRECDDANPICTRYALVEVQALASSLDAWGGADLAWASIAEELREMLPRLFRASPGFLVTFVDWEPGQG